MVQPFSEWLVAKYGVEEGRRRYKEWLQARAEGGCGS
jgi:hypothetical protein